MTALDRARRQAYLRLIPLLFASFVVAFVDRTNLAIAKLTMVDDLPGFSNAVFGWGGGMFFVGYVLLEIPGTLIVERGSARRWLGRIMITWGFAAALQAAVTRPSHFYVVRFLLGLAEAGFFPGVIVFLSHWFPARDRARATALFLAGTPVAQLLSPRISHALLSIGRDGHPTVLGMTGWQWVYVGWAVPALVLGAVVLAVLPDRPRDARWLTTAERAALEAELARERDVPAAHLTLGRAFRHPRVLLISAAYLCAVTAFYGIDLFLPSILQRWYGLDLGTLTWLLVVPAAASLVAQVAAGWSSDRTGERRLHAAVPLAVAALALAFVPASRGHVALTVTLFVIATVGTKSYLPAFWCLPTMFLAGAAAAGSTGFINSCGNLGGFLGSAVLGNLEAATGSFDAGLYFIAGAAALAAAGLYLVRGRSQQEHVHQDVGDPDQGRARDQAGADRLVRADP